MQPQNPDDPNQQQQPLEQPVQPLASQPNPGAQALSQPQQFSPSPPPIAPAVYPTPSTPLGQNGEDPGKKLAVLGNVLSVAVFFAPIGLVVSLIARKKSKDAGYPTRLANIGIFINAALIVVAVGMIAAFFAVLSPILSLDDDKSSSSSQTPSSESTNRVLPSAESSITLPGGGTLKKGMTESEVTKAFGKEPVNCTDSNDGSRSCFYSANFGDITIFNNGKLHSVVLESRQTLK